MREMKDSGIAWIGAIPNHWKVSKIKQIVCWKSVKGQPDLPVLSLYRDYGVIPKDSRDDNHNVTSLDTSGYKVVERGDLVINKMKAWQGSLAVSEYNGIVSPAYHICKITSENICKKYLHYLLRDASYLPEYMRLSTGLRVGQWDLSFDDFKNVPFLVPPLAEQERIAAFLDAECAEIDAVLEKTRASIEEYKKLKQAVITQAVTKGIRGDRPMKDSGIEWIGDIPAEWEVSSVRYIGRLQNGISKGGEFFGAGFPFVSYGDVYKNYELPRSVSGLIDTSEDERNTYSVEYGDIFFTRTSETIEEVGFSCVCKSSIPNATFAGFVIRLRPFCADEKILTDYAKYYFRGEHIRAYLVKEMNLVTRASLGQTLLKGLSITVPPKSVQREIAEYLDAKCAEIDRLIATKQQFLTELETYKKSIIYEYVTGKKEVHPL